jgi:DNA polymerase I-like protein with 3'-5' exonuclease and polymerase domains
VTRRRLAEQFPSLRGQGAIAVDCETCDPHLQTRGSGAWRDGFIAGVSVATEAGFRGYFPIAHEGGGNLPRDKVIDWLKVQLAGSEPKVGQRLVYDVGYLNAAGVKVGGLLYDVGNAEALLDDNRPTYSLDAISKSYLQGEGKKEDELYEFACAHAGKRLGKKKYKSDIWKLPAHVVAPYAIGDVDLPLRVFPLQRKKLKAVEGLWDLFLLETKLIPMLVAMHRRGVRVDLDEAEKMRTRFKREQEKLQREINKIAGFECGVWKAADLGRMFDKLHIEYPLTEKTEVASITRTWLSHLLHPVGDKVRRARWLDKMISVFLETCILDGAYKGRVHPQFNQLKSEEGGAVSGRFSGSVPNLQFIPIRTDEGKLLRTMFLPDEGQDWWKFDYSQIEYRLIAHDAHALQLPGSKRVVDEFKHNPDADFHQAVADMVGLDRGAAKTINFGLAYGEGVAKLCHDLGLERAAGEEIIDEYHRRAPFIRELSRGLQGMATVKGIIETILHRKRRFVWWVVPNWENWELSRYYRYRVNGSQRAYVHKALNARIQGSAADILKLAMVDIWESGVCDDDVLGPVQLTVHDELDGSAPKTKQSKEALAFVKDVMESVVNLLVPLRADGGVGPNWGAIE